MKKNILLIALMLYFVISLKAQNDKFNTFLANFKEVKMPNKILSTDVSLKTIDQKLAWEFSWQKNQYQSVEKSFVVPFGFYKITPEIGVVINAVTAEVSEQSTYLINIQTYNLKKGKLIEEKVGVLGSFSDYLKLMCQVEIDAKGNLSITTKGGYGKDVTTIINVSNKGKLKLL
jgi:hypothetical protein